MVMNFIRKLMYGRVWKRPALLFPPRGLYRPHSSVRPAPPGGALLAGAGSAPVGSVPHVLPPYRPPPGGDARFLALAGPAIRWLRMRRTIRRDKEHRYFKCPNCGQQLRVPRGKGKITVTCRGCGASFQEKADVFLSGTGRQLHTSRQEPPSGGSFETFRRTRRRK